MLITDPRLRRAGQGRAGAPPRDHDARPATSPGHAGTRWPPSRRRPRALRRDDGRRRRPTPPHRTCPDVDDDRRDTGRRRRLPRPAARHRPLLGPGRRRCRRSTCSTTPRCSAASPSATSCSRPAARTGLAPPDIPVGIVENVIQPVVGRGSAARGRPLADLDELHFVRVVLYKPASEVEAPRPTRRRAADARLARPGPAAAAASVGFVVLALQRTLFADLRPGGVALQVMLALAAAAGAGGRTAEGRPRRVRARPDVRPRPSARRSARRRSRWASAATSPATSRRSPSTRSGGWRRCSPASVRRRRSGVPVVPRFIGEEHLFGLASASSWPVVAVGRWCSARCSCRSAAGACASSAGVEGPEGSLMADPTRAPAPRLTGQTGPMAADKRAAPRRPGLVADAAVRRRRQPACGSCRPCRPTRCSRPSTARPRRSRLVPERGRIFDADGRILADNERVLTVAVDWEVIRATPTGPSCSPACRGGCRCRSTRWRPATTANLYSRYQPMPLKEDVEENVAIAIEERVEDFPGVTIEQTGSGSIRMPRWPATSSATWGRSPPTTGSTTRTLGYDTSSKGEQVGRSGVELSMESVLHGQWGEAGYEVDANNRIVREISYGAPVNGMDVQLSIDLDLQQYAERLLQTQLRLRRQFTPNPMVRGSEPTARRRGRWTRAWPSAPGALQGAGRLGDGDEPPDRPDPGDGELPDVRQPLVQLRGRQRQVRRALPRPGEDGPRSTPDLAGADQPGDPGPVQHGLGVQGRSPPTPPWPPACSVRSRPTTTRARTSCARSPTSCVRQGVRCVYRNSTCPPNNQAVCTAINVTTRAGRVERRLLLQARRGLLPDPGTPAAGLRARSSASAPTPASTCRSSSTGESRRTS